MEKRWGDSLKAEERKTKQQNREVTVQWMRQLKGGYRKKKNRYPLFLCMQAADGRLCLHDLLADDAAFSMNLELDFGLNFVKNRYCKNNAFSLEFFRKS